MSIKAAIRAIRYFLPERELANEELAQDCGGWDADKILLKTGVATRRIAAMDECASDLGVAAANLLFESGACLPGEIDFLIFCTQSPDYVMPPTACLVQDRLGLSTDCGAIDLNLGCSGFVYGLAVAKSMIETGTTKNVLLITAETYSKFINRRDRSARTIFGDGAAATLVVGIENDPELIGPFVFGTDGSGGRDIIIRAGGARRPWDAEAGLEKEDESGNWRSDREFYMNGPEVFNFAITAVPRALSRLLDKWQRPMSEVDYFVFHQASGFMLDHLRRKLKIPAEKFCLDLRDYGNTVSSTIPIALQNLLEKGTIARGDNVALVGFGVGYSWSAAMVQIA